MAKSRAEVLASLRGIFANGESKLEPKAEPKAKPAAAAAAATFGKFRKADAIVAVAEQEDEEVEDTESEDDVSDSDEDTEVVAEQEEATDVEVAPVEELLDRVESLIDYIADNSEALKSWIAACR